jgi:ferredoxin-like protein FixX
MQPSVFLYSVKPNIPYIESKTSSFSLNLRKEESKIILKQHKEEATLKKETKEICPSNEFRTLDHTQISIATLMEMNIMSTEQVEIYINHGPWE